MQNTKPKHYRQLQPEERMTLASPVHKKYSVGAIAKVRKRSTSSTRELKCNAQNLGYHSQTAITCRRQRRIQARAPNKLHDHGVLFGIVH